MEREFEKLMAFKKAYELAMEIFEISKGFPKEETFSLTNQIRKSSRSVCSNFAEGYTKRRYENHFIAKLSDCEMENTETYVWLKFAFDCKYLDQKQFQNLVAKNKEVEKLLRYMLFNPKKFCNFL